MDTDLLIAELLLRGFEHHKDDGFMRRMYMNDEVIVSIRGPRALVAARFYSIEGVLDMTDYALKKANGD